MGSAHRLHRTVVFLSKATPGDDEFALWLAPRLEAEGYTVFADILSLQAGDRWRKEITKTLQTRAIKMLLCCSDSTLARDNVQEEIGIALDLAKELNDPRFIIPLRLEPYKKVLGIGELQYVDFVRGWAAGLDKLLETLKIQKVPKSLTPAINPNWETFRRRGAIELKNEPERLTSNWLRIVEAPDVIRYFEPTGAVDRFALAAACNSGRFPAEARSRGFFAFGTLEEINREFATIGKFAAIREFPLFPFMKDGSKEHELKGQDASNLVQSMLRQAWNRMCRERSPRIYILPTTGLPCFESPSSAGPKNPVGQARRSSLRDAPKQSKEPNLAIWRLGHIGILVFSTFQTEGTRSLRATACR